MAGFTMIQIVWLKLYFSYKCEQSPGPKSKNTIQPKGLYTSIKSKSDAFKQTKTDTEPGANKIQSSPRD